MMAITVEDGSLVTNANSFVTRAEYISYAASLNITIADNDTADSQLIKAGEFIAHHEQNLKGEKVDRDQFMPFPRYSLYINGWSWLSTEIPREVILCQMAYALDINDGEDLYNRSVNPSQVVTKKRVEGAVEVNYAAPDTKTQKLGRSSRGDALLNSLLENNGLSIQLVRA